MGSHAVAMYERNVPKDVTVNWMVVTLTHRFNVESFLSNLQSQPTNMKLTASCVYSHRQASMHEPNHPIPALPHGSDAHIRENNESDLTGGSCATTDKACGFVNAHEIVPDNAHATFFQRQSSQTPSQKFDLHAQPSSSSIGSLCVSIRDEKITQASPAHSGRESTKKHMRNQTSLHDFTFLRPLQLPPGAQPPDLDIQQDGILCGWSEGAVREEQRLSSMQRNPRLAMEAEHIIHDSGHQVRRLRSDKGINKPCQPVQTVCWTGREHGKERTRDVIFSSYEDHSTNDAGELNAMRPHAHARDEAIEETTSNNEQSLFI